MTQQIHFSSIDNDAVASLGFYGVVGVDGVVDGVVDNNFRFVKYNTDSVPSFSSIVASFLRLNKNRTICPSPFDWPSRRKLIIDARLGQSKSIFRL